MDDNEQNLDDIKQLSQYIHNITKNIQNIDNQLNNSRQFSKQKCDTINENDDDDSPVTKKFYLNQQQPSTNESDSEIPNPFLRRYKIKKKLSLQAPSLESAPHKTYFSNSMSMTNCQAFPNITHKKDSNSIHEEIENIYQEIDTRNMSDDRGEEEDEKVQNEKALSKGNNNSNSKGSITKKKKPIKLLLGSSFRKNQNTNKVFNVTQLNNSSLSITNANNKKKNNLNLSACNNSNVNAFQSKILQKKKSSRNIQSNNDMIPVNNNNNSMLNSLRMTGAVKKGKNQLNILENSFNNNWALKSAKADTKTESFQKTLPSSTLKGKNIVPVNNSKVKKTPINLKHKAVVSSSKLNKQVKPSPFVKRTSNDSNKLASDKKPKQKEQQHVYKGISSIQFNDMLHFIKLFNDSKNNSVMINTNKEEYTHNKQEDVKAMIIQQKWREYFIKKNIIKNHNKHENIGAFCMNYLFEELDEDQNFREFVNELNKLNELYAKCIRTKKFMDIKRSICGKKSSKMSAVINLNLQSQRDQRKHKKEI